MNAKIVPGILTDSLEDLKDKVNEANQFCDEVCIDVIDGLYADNLTVMPESLVEVDYGKLNVSVQLMVIEPVDYLGYLHTAGVKKVYGQVERMGNVYEFVDECKHLGMDPGLAFDVYTPLTGVATQQILSCSNVLLMSVKAGHSGQEYISVEEKVKSLREMGFMGNILIDGGMNKETIPGLVKAGANQFSVTSAVWRSDDPALSYKELTGLLDS